MGKRAICKQIIERGNCSGIACDGVTGDHKGTICPLITGKYSCTGGEHINDSIVKAALLYLQDPPKKEKPPLETPTPKAFVPATEFIPGKFYVSEGGIIVLCQDGVTNVHDFFYGVSLVGTSRGKSYYNDSWIKAGFTGPVEVDISVKE